MSKIGPIVLSAFLILGGAVIYKGRTNINKQKQELANLDSARYVNACKRLDKELIVPSCIEDYSHNSSTEINFWRNEYKAVKDSLAALNSESAKKAYAKGIQNVGDSVKTAVKSIK